jgi:hypothetical protein
MSFAAEYDIGRLVEEVAAARTRKEAADIFESADWIFVGMDPREREARYAEIEDIIKEKPE